MVLTQNDILEILRHYNLGIYKSSKPMKHGHAAFAFLIQTTKGKFLLKEYSLHGRIHAIDLNRREFQAKVLEKLNDHGLTMPHLIRTKTGRLHIDYRNSRIFIQQYIEGRSVKRLTDAQSIQLAKIVGKINLILNKINYGKEYESTEKKRFDNLNKLYKIRNIDLPKKRDELYTHYNHFNFRMLKRALTHNDIRGDNIIVHKNKVRSVIDWDDLRETAVSYDLGVMIYGFFVRGSGVNEKQIKIFLKEYQKYIYFNDEEKKATYYFALLRILEVIAFFQWKKSKLKSDKYADKAMLFLARRYVSLEKFGLERFISLFSHR